MGSSKKKRQPKVAVEMPIPQLQHPTASTWTNYLIPLLLISAVVLLYGRSLWNPLIFDDIDFFVEPTLRRLGSSFFQLDLRWFAYASFGWTYNFFGQDLFWYRLGNIVLHGLTSILLFLFFLRLIRTTLPLETEAPYPWFIFFAVLLFALHPVAVYGVAYLIQRSILMATLFGIAALFCYLEGLIRDKSRWFVLSALFYFLAVFSKEHSIMIPGVAAALTLLFHKPSSALIKKLWLPFVLYLVIGLLVILRTKGVLGTAYESVAEAMLSQLSRQYPEVNTRNAYGLSVITEGFLFFKYLLLWVIPNTGWMSIDIRQPFATHLVSWPELPGFILFLAYPALALKLLLRRGRQGLLGLGLLFPWVLYLTELSSVRIQEPFVLYRSYLWMSGLPLVLMAIPEAIAKKSLTVVILASSCLLISVLAWNRLETFSNPLKLWSDAIEKNRDTNLLGLERIYNNRGAAYMNSGEVQKAMEDFTKAATLNPYYDSPHLNLGTANTYLMNFPEALQNYNAAIELRPDYAPARVRRSQLFLQMGQYADALKDCEYALKFDEKNIDAILNCSLAHSRLGKPQDALRYLDAALSIDPNLVSAYLSRSVINSRLGNNDAALSDLNRAAQLDPNNANIYYNRGIVQSSMGRYQEALQDFSRVIAINPQYVDAYVNRGVLYMMTKQWPQALLDFDQAIRLNPNQEDIYVKRGNIFAMQSRYQDALANYNQALKLNPANIEAIQSRATILRKLHKQK